MTVLTILAVLLGLALVLGGGCTLVFWTAALFEGGSESLDLALPLLAVGALATWGGVVLLRAIWRTRGK